MELLGSSHLGEPKQYCRTGAQEDPWISAGDHPDLIVYGENGDANQWHTGTDGSIDALNKGEPRRCCCRSWSGLDQSAVCRRLERLDQRASLKSANRRPFAACAMLPNAGSACVYVLWNGVMACSESRACISRLGLDIGRCHRCCCSRPFRAPAA